MKCRLLAVLMTACLLTGCNASDAKSEEPGETIIMYQALPLPEIYLEIPEHFEATSSKFYEEYYIHDDASIIVTEDTNGPFNSAYDYSISALVQYQDVAHTLNVTSQEEINGKNCHIQVLEFDYTLGEDDGLKLSTMVGYTTDSDSMYIITCKSDTSTYASHRNEFRSVLESVMMTKTGK